MNLGNIQTWASRFALDPGQTRYTQQQYLDAINEAVFQFALDSRCFFVDFPISIAANVRTYALPSDFMFEKKVTLATGTDATAGTADSGISLQPITRAQLEFQVRDHNWQDDNGTPQNFIIDPGVDKGNIVMYPVPQGPDAGTNNLILTYYPKPALLVNSTDIPYSYTVNGVLTNQKYLNQFHLAIPAYAAWLLTAAEPASESMAKNREDAMKIYNDKVTQCIDRYGNTASAPIQFSGGRLWR